MLKLETYEQARCLLGEEKARELFKEEKQEQKPKQKQKQKPKQKQKKQFGYVQAWRYTSIYMRIWLCIVVALIIFTHM